MNEESLAEAASSAVPDPTDEQISALLDRLAPGEPLTATLSGDLRDLLLMIGVRIRLMPRGAGHEAAKALAWDRITERYRGLIGGAR